MTDDQVVIIGSGPGGLAAAHALAKRNIENVILEKESAVAGALRRVDPEMRLLSPKGLSLMPDMHPEPGTPTYLPFRVLVHELERYQQQYDLNIKFDCTVLAIRKDARGFSVLYRAGDGERRELRCSHVINATGIISQPRLPDNFNLEPRRWQHSIDTRAEDLAAARELLVVGGGASAAEVLENWLQARQEGDRAWLSLRSKLVAIPHWILGIDVHYFSWLPEHIGTGGWLGRRVARVTEPMMGCAVVRAIRKGLIKRAPAVRKYKGQEVEFENGQRIEPDLIVFATGFSYALEHLKEVVDLDPDGRPLVRKCESTRTPGLFLLGYRFGRTFASPYLRGIARDAEYVAERIAKEKILHLQITQTS